VQSSKGWGLINLLNLDDGGLERGLDGLGVDHDCPLFVDVCADLRDADRCHLVEEGSYLRLIDL